MTPDMLKSVFAESGLDYSAEACLQARLTDLLPAALEDFRERWLKKSSNTKLSGLTHEQLLADAELMVDRQLTYAALILFGSRPALGRHLAQAEVIFEYRSSEASVPYQQRLEFRQGFFSFADELWNTINLRNDRQSCQDGLFRYDLPTFSEGVVREAILNAVGHRDYRHGGSIFVKQFPRHLEITNPGGFPPGITPENILDHQNPRNRRLAETFGRCGLIERSGQGMNRMFEETIRQSKPLPDFSGSDKFQVRLVLRGEVQNPAFVRYLERIGQERLSSFTTHDFVVLDCLQGQRPVPPTLHPRLADLLQLGVIEKAGRSRFILSRSLYAHLGQTGTYTRVRGLSDAENSALLLKHICDNGTKGSPLTELVQVVPSLGQRHVQYLLKRLKDEGKVVPVGGRRWAKWFPAKDKNTQPAS
jgi:ATP-dependent DNA helicase RecG